MAYVGSERAAPPASLYSALVARVAEIRAEYAAYREKRVVYLRTLRELQSYRPHELNDLRIHSADFEGLARKQAGL